MSDHGSDGLRDGDAPDEPPHEPAPEPASLAGLLAGGAWAIATKGPRFALGLAHKTFDAAEKLALSRLRRRLDEVAPPPPSPDSESGTVHAGAGPSSTRPIGAAAIMARLLETAQDQSPATARESMALRTVRRLVPDEARILAALADGHAAPLVHLGAGAIVGPATQRWLENLSPIGRDAGVALIEETPRYITHLRELGLLESGEEDKSQQLKYQIIEADTKTRETCAAIEKAGLRPKFFRRTIRMSDAGRAFWEACEPPGDKRS